MQGQENIVIVELREQLQQAAASVTAAEQETAKAVTQLAAQQEAHSKALHQLQVRVVTPV